MPGATFTMSPKSLIATTTPAGSLTTDSSARSDYVPGMGVKSSLQALTRLYFMHLPYTEGSLEVKQCYPGAAIATKFSVSTFSTINNEQGEILI